MDSSYLTQQLSTIITQLHGLFDEIGVPSHERDSRESDLFTALSETLHNQLRLVSSEKQTLHTRAETLITEVKQMESSLDDTHAETESLRITYPLLDCIDTLQQKHTVISRLHRERYDQVRKLVEALESYASHLESGFVKLRLPPPPSQNKSNSPSSDIPKNFDLSPKYVESLDQEFTRVYDEYIRRVGLVQQMAEEMIQLWAELGTPQAQTDTRIVECAREAPEQLGLHAEDVKRLEARRNKLMDEKKGREKRIRDLRSQVEELWERLGVEEPERRQFIAKNKGVGMRVLNDYEAELGRLNELKKANLHIFVEDARQRLQELWDQMYFSEEEMLDFTPAFSDVYSDALLSAHEAEISRLESLKEQRLPTLQLIDKHRSIIKDREDLQSSAQDSTRLLAKGNKGERRDPTRLLREEKMRKRIAKDLPKIEAELIRKLTTWEDEYGRPFLVHGERYLDELEMTQRRAAAAAPPARSKTPNALHRADSGKSTTSNATVPRAALNAAAPKSTTRPAPGTMRAKTPTASRPVSMLHNSSILSTANTSTIHASTRPDFSHSTRTGAPVSPSRIPARAPLGRMNDGNNSPERRAATMAQNKTHAGATVRPGAGNMGPPRAPPPRMKDLFVPPTPDTYGNENIHMNADRSASIVRQIEPEDVYADHCLSGYAQAQSQAQAGYAYPPSSRVHSGMSGSSAMRDYPHAPASRQISVQSTASMVSGAGNGSGSENWETFSDGGSEYSTSQNQHSNTITGLAGHGHGDGMRGGTKRPVAAMAGAEYRLEMEKRLRGFGAMMNHPSTVGEIVGAGESEAGWSTTDDGAF